VALTGLVRAEPGAAQGMSAGQVEAVDALFVDWSDPAGPGAAVAITRNGQVIYSQGYGSAQLEYRIPVTPTTPFHVASVSKQFTTFAVALLAHEGALSWDDPVQRHLPEIPDLGHPVTLRQLAQHTSGVRDQWELLIQAGWRIDDVITRDQILALMLRQRELNFEPGSEYLYSNMGYSLLAEVVERVSGEDFGAFLRERVFLPLGMHRTHVHADHTRIVPGRAYSYAPNPSGGWRNAVLSYANQGATSLFTTVEDLGRWMAEMDAPVVGSPALWAEMTEPARLTQGDTVPYGLGLSVGRYRGLSTQGHGGSDAGFRTNLLYFPEERVGVVVFGNASAFNAARLAQQVAEVLLEDRMAPAEAPAANAQASAGTPGSGATEPDEPVVLPAQVMAAYEGSYYSPELDVLYRIRVSEGVLVVERPRQPVQPLSTVELDRFRSTQWGINRVDFVRDEREAVVQMLVSGGRVRNVRFHRVEPWGF
jgi:CubicO group peptidase (beta-lactamase class C family)